MAVSRFKIGTFNLLNLVLPGVPFYGFQKYTEAEYLAKKGWIRRQLEDMNADILGFQEVFHTAALRAILSETAGYGEVALVAGPETGNSPIVALASRFPIAAHQVIVDFPKTAQLTIGRSRVPVKQFSRPVLRVEIDVPAKFGDRRVVVFVVHLKSKRPLLSAEADPEDPIEVAKGSARSLIVRAAEAMAMRQLLVDTMRGNELPVMVLGDINDSVGAVTSQIMSGTAPYKRLTQAQKAAEWDVLLSNVKDLQAQVSYEDVYYTHIFNGHYESLDHIYVSNEFVRANPRRAGYVEYVKVLNDHLIDETLSNEAMAKTRSDHGQVVATIKLERPASRSVTATEEGQTDFSPWDAVWDEQRDAD